MSNIDYKIDPGTWFGEREISHAPKHFVVAKTPLTDQSKKWVIDTLKGRYCVITDFHYIQFENVIGQIAFEDPEEVIFYELRWS